MTDIHKEPPLVRMTEALKSSPEVKEAMRTLIKQMAKDANERLLTGKVRDRLTSKAKVKPNGIR
jgi:hypothetical protein